METGDRIPRDHPRCGGGSALMRGAVWLLGLLLTTVAPAAAQVRSRMVDFPGARGPVRAFLTRPAGPEALSPIVMIHERWGLTAWVRDSAERLAARGYVVLAVDVYRG